MQLEIEMNTRTANESKTVSVLDAFLQKLENTEIQTGQFQQQLQEQKNEMRDMMDMMNAVLTEAQSMSVQVDMLIGPDNVMNAGEGLHFGNVEEANWPKLGKDQKDEIGIPQTLPVKETPEPAAVKVTAPMWTFGQVQTPLFGTIVPSHVPPTKESKTLAFTSFGAPSFSLGTEKKSPSGFEFPVVSGPMQNLSSSG